MSTGHKQILCGFASTSTRSQAGSAPTVARIPRSTSRAAFFPARSVPRKAAAAVRPLQDQNVVVLSRPFDRNFPEPVWRGPEAGHEIGAHGYSHENSDLDDSAARKRTCWRDRSELVQKLAGKGPRGYVAPWWEMSAVTAELLLKYGFRYDHSRAQRF